MLLHPRERIMKINLDSGFILGAATLKETEKGLYPSRMTDELMKFYSYSEAAVIRAKNSSGIKIAFLSNTNFVRMKLTFGVFSRQIFNTDIIINGTEKLTFGPPEDYEENFSFEAPINAKKENLIEIYLPNMCETRIVSLEIADGASLEAAPCMKYPKSIFIGDSISQGMTVSSPALTYPAQISAKLKKSFYNIAVGGAVMAGDLGQLALAYEWDTAFIAFGVNDFNTNVPLEQLESRTEALLKGLSTRSGISINLITPIHWAGRTEPNSLGIYLDSYRETIRKTGAGFSNVKVIDGRELVPDDPGMFVDNVHPNDAGMTRYAAKLLEKIS